MYRYEFIGSIDFPREVDENELDMIVYRQMKHAEYVVNVLKITSIEEAEEN